VLGATPSTAFFSVSASRLRWGGRYIAFTIGGKNGNAEKPSFQVVCVVFRANTGLGWK
jgi:hypothetical protein